MAYPLPCDADGLIQFAAREPALEQLIKTASVVAVGPGLGQSDDIRQLVRFLITSAGKPLVIDADGLNALVGQTELLSELSQPVIVTPHPGEFARLTGAKIRRGSGRPNRASHWHGRTVEVTGRGPQRGRHGGDGRTAVLHQHDREPGMATGGTGDVLTGVIAALLAQKLAPFEAAQIGVFIHGLAGDIARDQNGEIGMIAGDLVDALPDAFVHAMPDPDLGLAQLSEF